MRLPAVTLLLLAACTSRAPPPAAEVAKLFEGCSRRGDTTVTVLACPPGVLVELRPLRGGRADPGAFLDDLMRGYGGAFVEGVGPGRAVRRIAKPPEVPVTAVQLDIAFDPSGTNLAAFGDALSAHCGAPPEAEPRCRALLDFVARHGVPDAVESPR